MKLREVILAKRNKAVTPESITNWFRRHPENTEQLHKEVIEEELPQEEVSTSIFDNGTFEELTSVKKWLQEMQDRDLSPDYIANNLQAIKRICQGYNIKDYVLKHPDRLTISDAKEYLRARRQNDGIDDNAARLAARDFFLSKGIVVKRTEISGQKHKSFGKHAWLFVERDKLEKIFQAIQMLNYEVYAYDYFMYKTGTRATSALGITTADIRGEYVQVMDKGRHAKGREVWLKYIDEPLEKVLRPLIIKSKTGKIFENITYDEARNITRSAFKDIIPSLEPKITMPLHFFRHQFAQHMLRACDWNYDVVASLGGWKDTNTLKQCYGMPPKEVIKNWAKNHSKKLDFMPQI